MLFLVFLLSFCKAAFIISNLRIEDKNILKKKKTSTNELKTSASNEKLSSSQSQSRLSVQSNPSFETFKHISLPLKYKPSAPIPIPYKKEVLDLLKTTDLSKQTNSKDDEEWYQYIDDSSSASSGSSENSSLGELLMFEMSYDPICEEMRKLRQSERENRRRIKKELKKKNNSGSTKEPIKPESSKPVLYYSEGEEEDLAELAKKRTARYRNISNIEINNSEFEMDSDFGGEDGIDTCYSISF